MIEALTGMGYAIIALAVVIGIGLVILGQLTNNIVTCPSADKTINVTGGTVYCSNATSSTAIPSSSAGQQVTTLSGYLGTSSGGLATWIPIIIVLLIGMLFLGVFLARKGSKS